MKYKTYGKGWWGFSHQHSLAAKGIKTRFNSTSLSFANKMTILKRDEINNWLIGHDYLDNSNLVDMLVEKYDLTKHSAEELIKQHRRQLAEERYGGGAWRVSIAAKNLNGKKVAETDQGIPVTVKDKEGSERKYPISPEDAKKTFDKMPDEMVNGITEINFRDPGIPATKQDKAWAQYVRSKRRINIFSQPCNKSGKFQEVDRGLENKSDAKKYMMAYVVPHETAHHHLQHNLKLNQDPEIIEEARADALTYGDNPFDPKVIRKHVAYRQEKFGSKGTI